MIILGNFLTAIGVVLGMLLNVVLILVIARAVISWVNPDPYNPIVRFLTSSTDPLLRPLQRYIPAAGGIDFSPIILIILIYFLDQFLVQTIIDYGRQFKLSGFTAPPVTRHEF